MDRLNRLKLSQLLTLLLVIPVCATLYFSLNHTSRAYQQLQESKSVAEVEKMRQTAFRAGSASRPYVILGQIVEHYGFRGLIHSEKNALIRPEKGAEYVDKLKNRHGIATWPTPPWAWGR